MNLRLAALFVGFALVVPKTAWAEPSPVALQWKAPEGCPDDAYVRDGIASLLRGSTASNPIEASASVEADSGRFRVVMKTKQGEAAGARTIEADTCKQAADAAALVLAMLVDPSRVALTESTPTSNPEPVLPPPPKDIVRASVAEAPIEAPPRRIHVALIGSLDSASLPKPAPGLGAAAGYYIAPIRIEGAFSVFPPREIAIDETRGGRLRLVTASLRGEVPFGSVVEIAPMAGLELGVMSGEGYGVRRPESGSFFWSALLFGAVARWPARDLAALRVSVEGSVPFRRDEFVLDGSPVHRAAAISVRGTLGAEIRFQ